MLFVSTCKARNVFHKRRYKSLCERITKVVLCMNESSSVRAFFFLLKSKVIKSINGTKAFSIIIKLNVAVGRKKKLRQCALRLWMKEYFVQNENVSWFYQRIWFIQCDGSLKSKASWLDAHLSCNVTTNSKLMYFLLFVRR